MKRFIFKTIGFGIIICSLLVVLEFWIFPSTVNVMTFKNQLISEHNDTELLILGNSHTMVGVIPKKLSYKSINIANDSRKLETDYYILKNNIEKLKKLKSVVLPISFYSLFSKDISVNEKRLYYQFYKINEYDQGFLKNRIIGNVPIKEHFDNIFRDFKGRESFTEFGRKKTKLIYKENIPLIEHKLSQVGANYKDEKIIDKNLQIVNRINKLCQLNKVKLTLVIPPYHPHFYQNGADKLELIIAERLTDFNKDINVLVICPQKEDFKESKYFKDPDHLSNLGAEKFSDMIDSKISMFLKNY